MTTSEKSVGKIEISTTAVESVVERALNQCYGVIGMAGKGLLGNLTQRFMRQTRRGIEVSMQEDGIELNIYVILQYGTRIRAVAESVQNTTKFHIEKSVGLPVKKVNVFVQGLSKNEE